MRAAPLALIVAWSGLALADEADNAAHVQLEWVSICSSREDVLEDIARLLHRSPGGRRPVDARVTIEREGGAAWKTRLVTRGRGGARERVFDAESCEAATEAVVLMLAMAVNPEVATAASTPSPDPPPPPPPPPPSPIPLESPLPEPAAVRSPEPVAASAPPALPPLRVESGTGKPFLRQLSLIASLAVDAGTMPRVAAGAEGGIVWHPGRFALEVAAANWVGQSASSGGAGAQFSLATVDARAAYGWSFGSVTLAPVADIGIGFVGASGFGGTQSDFKVSRPLPELGAGGSIAWRIAGPFLVRLLAESLVLPSHPSFVVVNPTPTPSPTVHAPSPVVGRAIMGAELNF